MTEAGRKILRFQFAHMLIHETGTRNGENAEDLHDMRVATRRMRAAFDVFGHYFKHKVAKKHIKRLRTAGRTLGRVRDLDVFMEKARHHLETLPESERSGLAPLLEIWEQKRTRKREKLVSYLENEKYGQFKLEFNEFISTPEESVISNKKSKPDSNLVKHVVPILIYTRLKAARSYEAIISNAAAEQLHALRIEFKKLRYTMEFFREVLGKEAKIVIDELKTLQDHLGDLNDANVACQILSEFIKGTKEAQNELPLEERQSLEPMAAYLAAKHAERHSLMVAFPALWEHFNRPETMKNIALSISGL
jgi:CHAD domain-containing protein